MKIEAFPTEPILRFLTAKEFGIEKLKVYYSDCQYGICESSLGVKLMWERTAEYRFAEAGDCLVCLQNADGQLYFDYPIPRQDGKMERALEEIERYCVEKELPLRFITVPAEGVARLATRYVGQDIKNEHLWRDYVYSTQEITSFAGKKFSGQRNHVSKFRKCFPQAVFRKMTEADKPALLRFLARFDATVPQKSANAKAEREAAFEILRSNESGYFRIGCMEIDGEIAGVSLSEKNGDQLTIHIEKALASEYAGIYPALFQETVRAFAQDCHFVNREDDAADRGLRTSKHQYHPVRLVEKFTVLPKTLLAGIKSPPCLQTERLRLDGITEEDAPLYGRLCRDDERNCLWGYDYRKDLPENATDMDFYRALKADQERGICLNFAIRYDGRFVGEVVLHRPDYQGELEIGVRIFPTAAGLGIGREALNAVSDWALYTLGATRIRARCFKENAASRRMLKNCMKQVREDEKMLYFSREI